MRPILSREECERRLRLIFPGGAFPSKLANPLGGCAVAAMLYVNAVVPDEGEIPPGAVWARPGTVLWMMDEILEHTSIDQRVAYRKAAERGKKQVAELAETYGLTHTPWRADTTREPLRDETWREWANHGAARKRTGIARSSPVGIWALTASFAELFNPTLSGDQLSEAIETWRRDKLDKSARIRVYINQQKDDLAKSVEVTLPNGQKRSLTAGEASIIVKGVIEEWAPRKLDQPVLLTISEPGDKYHVGDRAFMEAIALHIDVNALLPDLLMLDHGTDPIEFWIIEVVATDGPVSEARRRDLESWAETQGIPAGSCNFLTAFISRNSTAARKHLREIAVGTFVWYADEPSREVLWREIPPLLQAPDNVHSIQQNQD